MYEYFHFDYGNAVFEWDDEKAAINFTKHGIRFETASKVFADENKLIRIDEEHPWEKRYNVLGRVGKVLFVVCTLKQGNTVRMISARRATEPEKARYEHGEDYDE
ncbi:MAG: BrnT family toxin [Lachnospiraceae bacterium]|nr:BrnT family toxin [Lachnospiraceae bacterium]